MVLLIDIPVFPRDAACEPDAEVSSHVSSHCFSPCWWSSLGECGVGGAGESVTKEFT